MRLELRLLAASAAAAALLAATVPNRGLAAARGSTAPAPTTAPASAPAPAPVPAAAPRSVLAGEPGYTPPMDPESSAVETGRRDAPAVSASFSGGARSLKGLAREILAAVRANDAKRLHNLSVSRSEFWQILWPEFPQSRPVTGATADDGWYFLVRRNLGGTSRLVQDYGGQKLTLVRVECTGPVDKYRNFNLHRGLTIVAKDSTGALVRIDDLRTAAERKGVYKIYSMRD